MFQVLYISMLISIKKLAKTGISVNVQIGSGEVAILKTLILLIENTVYLSIYLSLISLSSCDFQSMFLQIVLLNLFLRFFYILCYCDKYFFIISYFSCSLQAYKNIIDFLIPILYSATLINWSLPICHLTIFFSFSPLWSQHIKLICALGVCSNQFQYLFCRILRNFYVYNNAICECHLIYRPFVLLSSLIALAKYTIEQKC